MNDTERLLGEYGAKIEALQREMVAMEVDLKIILATLSEVRGGWKTLVQLGVISGAIGAFLGWLAHYLGFPSK